MNEPDGKATQAEMSSEAIPESPARWPLICCAAECIGDVARFLLKVEAGGGPGSIMTPVIVQPNWHESVRVTFRSTVSVDDLRQIARGIPDCHRLAETMAQMQGGPR